MDYSSEGRQENDLVLSQLWGAPDKQERTELNIYSHWPIS